jgi:hypothetical protein
VAALLIVLAYYIHAPGLEKWRRARFGEPAAMGKEEWHI